MVAGENVLDVSPMYGPVTSHPLKVPRHEVKALHEIIITFITREVMTEFLNQMLNPKGTDMLSSQVVVRDAGKDFETLDEHVVSSDEDIFMGCSIYSRAHTMFNRHTKSRMEFIKVFVNDFQIEVTPHQDEDSEFTSHNVELIVVDNIRNNLQSVEVKKVAAENFVVKRESAPVRKKAHAVEDVNNNLNDKELPLNKKR